VTNAMPPAAMPNKAFFEKVGMFKAKSKELTFPVDQKRGAGQSESVSESVRQSLRLRLDRRLEDALAAARVGVSRRRAVFCCELRVMGSSGIPRNEVRSDRGRTKPVDMYTSIS